ncbi:rho GTPase-activating protein 18-like isoform X1 [Biomphalaria pfeifferi]|uniref:Rho GTPase-activating protein 18-like isoform X1 n=1 Tax=Biomphalaria pfeifferi TaxID=112525 RepID=A0AAD8FK55_BIOPF|nr:rho GTPase-activating protein 18-like isoform X1 [Biomphalaria pfeifferi]
MAVSSHKGMDDYWNEFQTIEQSDSHSDEDELSKTPDEGEIEEAWLKRAGYSHVISQFKEGGDISEADLDLMTSSLTHAQREAVRKRINILTTTMRKKDKVTKIHVKDIFAAPKDVHVHTSHANTLPQAYTTPKRNTTKSPDQRPSSPFSHKGGYSMAGGTNEITSYVDAGVATLGIHHRTKSKNEANHLYNFSDTSDDMEIHLDFTTEELEKPFSPVATFPDPHRIELPAFDVSSDPLGITYIGDLADCDIERVRELAFIELTALLDAYNIDHKPMKRKRKVKDQGIFGLPLKLLVEQDQKRSPGTKVPVVFQAMIDYLEKEGLNTEGIFRVSASDARTKQLRQDLEDKLYQGLFSWGDAGVHDVAVVFKQFLRELPSPLLSNENFDAFPQVCNIPDLLKQLKALNLLIILLTDEHRNTLKVLLRFLRKIVSHSNMNKMGLNNIAMIMAPNLFLLHARSKEKLHLETELKKAESTSKIVTMLIHYQDSLWTVPSSFIAQLRHQYTVEAHRKADKSLLSKFSRKKEKTEDKYKKLPNNDQLESQDVVIKVQAPHLTKSSALVQLDNSTTAADVVDKFKCENGDTIGEVETSAGHVYRNPNNAHYAHDTDYLFEVGGNIAERCLDPRTKMMELYHVNPTAEWVIKSRKYR